MYAIVEIAGQQFKIEKDQQIFVHRLDAKEGSKVAFDKVPSGRLIWFILAICFAGLQIGLSIWFVLKWSKQWNEKSS